MASQEIHVGDIGTEFRITVLDGGVVVNLSSATSLLIVFKKPDSTNLEVDGSLYTDGTDGIIFYNAVDGDIDQSGVWKVQAVVQVNGGTFSSTIGSFKVHCNL